MYRSLLLILVATACVEDSTEITTAAVAETTSVTREHVAGDVYHYQFVVRVGDTPNASLHIHRIVRERAPWIPRRSETAVVTLHGDFASNASNFLPEGGGLAGWLAARDVDVWGVDRRYVHTPTDGDLSDFDAMSLDQELDDLGVALAFARGVRLITDRSTAKLTLVGFSRGGMLSYFYASRDAARPAALRHVKGIVPIDVFVSLSPEDEAIRQNHCISAEFEYADLAAGFADSPNRFQIRVGTLAATAPDDQTPFQPFYPGLTNRQVLFAFMGQTYQLFAPSPLYHLNGLVFDATGAPTGFRSTPEDVIERWLMAAPPHSSLREAADTDALTCGTMPPPADVPLSRIRVPLLLLAAAGGYGEQARFSTTQVSSTDVTVHMVRQLPVEREAEDFGHGDLLYSPEAPALAWEPLLAWLRAH